MERLKLIGTLLFSPILFIASLFPGQPATFSAVVNKPIPRFESQLAIAIDATATTSITMVRGTDVNGNSLSGSMCFTLDASSANTVEDVCGTASGTIVSNLTRGIGADGVTSVASLAHIHRVGANVKVTDSPYLSQYYRLLNGVDTFPNALVYTSHPALGSASNTIMDKSYVDAAVVAQGVPMSFTIPGIAQLATTSQSLIGTPSTTVSSTQYYLVVPNSAVSQSSSANKIPMAKTDGTIDSLYIDQSTSSAYNFAGRISMRTSTTTATSTDAFNLLPAGVIQMYAATSSPAGWLFADGSEYVTSTYPRLFQVIGYAFGGSTSTFKVPNMSGRFAAGPSSTLSTTVGATGGSLTATGTATGTISYNISLGNAGGNSFLWGNNSASQTATSTVSVTATPPYMILNYIIKY